MSNLPRACMGGWCTARDTCARYHAAAQDRALAVERLCPPGTTAGRQQMLAAHAPPQQLPQPSPQPAPPPPLTEIMAGKHYPNSMHQRLRELAARPDGLAIEELQGMPARNTRQALYTLTNVGQLHPSRSPNGHNILRWFACPEAALAHQVANAAARPRYTPQRRARPPVEVRDDAVRRYAKAPRGATGQSQAQAKAARPTPAQIWAATPAIVPADVRITAATPPQGKLAGQCPPDRPPPLRAGATDYQRYMARYQSPGSGT